ncbi:MAG: GvpL/GvpF family gas vesicle protein [Elusimicrobia bacterium]|nr:GvpL/GvpF family gas vesicle protein [Elusimicrobiota bacterium]
MGEYIYCITRGDLEAAGLDAVGVGEGRPSLSVVAHKDIAAVVSESQVRKYPVCAENTLAHERAVEAVFRRGPVLPVRFCTIAESRDKVLSVMEREYDRFRPLLDRMEGKVELGVKAVFHPRLVYEKIQQNGRIQRQKDSAAGLSGRGAQSLLIEIGRTVEALLEEEKGQARGEIVGALEGLSVDHRLSDRLLGERMILNASFLVERGREAVFEKRMEGLSAQYGELVKFKFVVDLPPFSFVSLSINLE